MATRYICALLLVAGCGAGVRQAAAIDIRTDASAHRQRFEAWGTSLAWMGNELGGSSNTFRRDQIMDLLFDQTNGLGLNFVRYNIGAGQNPAGPAITRPGGDMDGWAPNAPADVSDPSTWQWDWNADATQRWVLDAAIARGVSQVEAFANSAPWWMTIAQSSTGNPAGGANLDTDHYDEFTHYLLEVAEHFEQTRGVHFNTLAPMNEPGAGWWTGGSRQEGMNVPLGPRQTALVRELGREIANRGLDIGVVAPEETSTDQTLDSWRLYGSTTKSYVSQINTHSYPYNGGSGSADSEALLAAAEADGKKIYATEFGTGGNSTPLSGGITLANQIRTDLRALKAPGWTYWQAVEDNNGSNWGLIIAPFDGANNWFNMRKQYYALQQFSSYIRPGAQVLEQPIQEVIAAYDPRTMATTLVITNDESTTDVRNFDLLDQTAAYTRVIRTTDAESFKSLGPATASSGGVTVNALGNSITTVVVHHQPNLIRNAGFDLGAAPNGSTAITGWEAEGGRFDAGHDNAGDGSGSAALYANNTANSGRVFQTGIGDADVDLTGMAFQLSLDVRFQNAGNAFYDADTYLALEFYGADDQTLTHASGADFQTKIIPALGIDETRATDSDYRTFRSEAFVAPPGARYVRPVIRYGNVDSDSTDWVYLDNAYLAAVHPYADAREWSSEGDGNWSDDTNWMSHASVAKNSRQYFGNAIGQSAAVTVDNTEAVSELTFFSEHAYHLLGDGALTIGPRDWRGSALIDARVGSHRVSVAAGLSGRSRVQVLPGASLTFDGGLDLGGNVMTKLGAGVLDLSAGLVMNGGRIEAYAASDATIILGADAVLDGSFSLLLAPGQDAQAGDVFELAAYASLSDVFDDLLLPALPGELTWRIDYGANALTAEVIGAILYGDFNDDGVVDAADYTVWRDNLGALDEASLMGNGDGLNGVDTGDYLVWRSNFGATQPALASPRQASSNAAPEPTGGVLSALVLVALAIRRRPGRGAAFYGSISAE